MSDELLNAAEAEARHLRDQLAKNPLYARLQTIEKFIRDLKSVPAAKPVEPLVGNLQKAAKYGRQGSVSATVIEASEAFLRKIRRRAMTSEILSAIEIMGVTVPGKTPGATLSSYLSTSTLFDNVRGEGYGLTEWNQHRVLNDEAPDSDELSSAPKNNGQLPLNS